jgi:CRISPR system Cascade subunit CasB
MSWLLEGLQKYKDNRGMMANLRCVLVDNKRHRAWPVLHRLGVEINDEVPVFVTGLFAVHHEQLTSTGNFGATCKAIERSRGEQPNKDNKLTSTERRFQHLLSAEGRKERHERVMRMVLMAKFQGVPVNYEQLEIDLQFWNDWTKTKWAEAFWAQGAVSSAEEDV